ncbi:MAG: serine/threonine-protein phosphatase [Microbacteriaceae bacterium]|nr:serine/threonine-protein phosphatase [Cryobacterium sp.]MBX3103704.1 serine/threonine-protein phosphatase [Cryobacterium sp.]MCC6376243.1 serine/threonine-protein phosphatase [Microbacteriaceae bacterium]
MAISGKSAAVSNVGRIRSDNQDSGYAGRHLFLIADGMGGHAGGDVASAIAVKRIIEVDQKYSTPQDAEFALKSALLSANAELAETAFDHPELTGMGTTVSALIRVGNSMALAHIGDSRIYLLRDGVFEQVSVDHTFVQRLVDSGRITQEEAAVHPRRSVLMRVLGDIDSSPEIDTAILDTRPGDRWLICSDGLSSYVSEDKIFSIMSNFQGTKDVTNRLVKESLDQGAPDNVTVVIVDVGEGPESASNPPSIVGSAALPLTYEAESAKRALRLPTLLLHPLKSTQHEDSHFEPESEEYLDELILEDKRRAFRRKITWLVGVLFVIVAIVVAIMLGYRWTQTHYYVGANGQTVAIFQGVQQNIGPISLHTVYQQTSIKLENLSPFTRETIEETINATDLQDAQRIINQLLMESSDG